MPTHSPESVLADDARPAYLGLAHAAPAERPSRDHALELATLDLHQRHPDMSAARVITPPQGYALAGVGAAIGLGFLVASAPTLIALVALGTACLASAF